MKMKKTRVKTGKRKFGESESDPRHAAAQLKGRKKQRGSGKGRQSGRGAGTGPRLPLGIKRELASLARDSGGDASDSGNESTDNPHPGDSVYEYDEPLPQEETKKNRRFDPVENFEFELPEDFQDEEIDEELASVGGSGEDDDGDFGFFGEDLRRSSTFGKRRSEENDDVRGEDECEYDGEDEEQAGEAEEANYDDGDHDPERHSRLLQEITGLPRDAFERNLEKALSSKINLEPEEPSGLNEAKSGGTISVQDLLDPLYGKPGYSSLRKRMHHLERKSEPVRAPLPKVIQERLDRTSAYKLSKDDITKWEPLVKKNREAPTIYFGEEVQARIPTVGEIASEFKPRTSLEQKISSILGNAKVVEAHMKDGAALLELNKISVESVRERQGRLAKMRSLLFRHEMKAKHIKKIKSKTYHRILKKNKLKSKSVDVEADPEAAKEHAMKQEFKRAEERMTLKHKNSSKWARRILKRGLNAQDEGTRTAISEQLNQHALLTRKMNSMKDNSSSDSSTDEEDEEEASASDDEQASKLLKNAKDKTIKIIEEEQEIPKSGLLSLPFMVRGMEKKKEAAYEEARSALDEYDSSLNPTNGSNGTNPKKKGASSGRMVFGDTKKQSSTSMSMVKQREFSQELNSEDDEGNFGNMGNDNACPDRTKAPGNVDVDPTSLLEDLGIQHDPVLKSADDLKRGSGPRTTFEVSICAPESLVQGCKDVNVPEMEDQNHHQNREEVKQLACSDSADESEEDNQSVESMSDYELPSMPELIKRAFASDDVEEEFEKEKLEALNEEVPMPEKPMSLPGWGQWTDVQEKKGLPSWILEEHEIAKRNRENALKLRKDAELKHVIISERTNKKAEKFYTPTLPFPHKYEEVFKQSMRVPLGPDFNPAKSFRELNRPPVIKTPGVPINPITFKEVNPLDSKLESNTGNENRKSFKMKGAKKKNSMKKSK
ncbi:uncharacterized protein LOC116254265 [Nymphaea colorata]|nr:uncharacterized protein LOC116254265 [Nymphaea colorata]